ncbi:DUF2249 domain-containing protein [Bacillus sp. SCS-151]|uniref:DUF2249 domain-containing protein n=1 Tax=Nanhaiella sioensis TaxID=3115293 RepID=UPI00397D8B24
MNDIEAKNIVELDVREDINKKLQPFQKITNTVSSLKDDDIFILHAPIKPTPLLTIMKTKGFTYTVEKIAAKHWKVTFVRGEKNDS